MKMVSGYTIEIVDYDLLREEIESRLGYSLSKFHKYYLDNLHIVEDMKLKYIEAKKKPYISSYPKYFEGHNHDYSLLLEDQFLSTSVGRLLVPEARHYLNFWHAVVDTGLFVRGQVCTLHLSKLPPWCDPIVKEIHDILKGQGVIVEDYYEGEYLYYHHDW